MKKYSNRIQSLLEFVTLLVVVVVANILANVYYQRVDLTSEARYTLSETSKKLAKGLKEKLYFRLYLDGETSARFKTSATRFATWPMSFARSVVGTSKLN